MDYLKSGFKRSKQFFLLNSSDRRLFATAALWLFLTGALLKIFPFWNLHRSQSIGQGSHSLNKIIWSIELASRYSPIPQTCLSRALVAQRILRQNGHDARLCIGAKKIEGRFQAHAWIENAGEIVLGSHAEGEYQLLKNPKESS